MDPVLRHNRAKLVRKYRQNPNLWPDGIDTMDDPWYAEGKDWPADKVELWATPGWLDDQVRGVTRVTPVTGNVTPSVTQGEMSAADKRRAQVRARVERYRAKKLKDAANDAGG